MPLTIHRRSFSPAYTPQDQQAYIAAQQAREAAAIQERAQRDQSAQEARQRLIDSQNEARLNAAATLAAAKQQDLLTRSNMNWFQHKGTLDEATKLRANLAIKEIDLLHKELTDPFTKKDRKQEILGTASAPGLLDAKKQEFNALLTSAPVVTADVAPVAPVPIAPTPQGFISDPTTGRNVFSAEPTPLGMNRQQSNEWAAKKNAPPEIGNMWMPEDSLLASPAKAGSGFIGSQAGGANAFQAAPQAAPVQAPQAVAAPKPAIPKSHIQALIANPKMADFFNQKYGAGAAEKVLQSEQDATQQDTRQP